MTDNEPIEKAHLQDSGVDLQAFDMRNDPFTPIGAPGTAITGGFIVEQEKDSRLVGTEKYRTYADIIANVSVVGAGARLFLNLIGKAEWTAEPADESPEAVRIAGLVQDIMGDTATPWPRIVRNAATFRLYGFSIMEMTAKLREDGVIGLDDIERRPQVTIERWDRDSHGKIQGAIQRSPQSYKEIYLPRGKFIYLVDDALNDSPEGLGLMRHLVKDAHKLRRYELLEGFGYERDLRGVPVGRAPFAELAKKVANGSMTKAEAEAQLEPLKKFVSKALRGESTGLVLDSTTYRSAGENKIPSDVAVWDVRLLSGDSNGLTDMAKAIERLTRNLARGLGVEQILLGDNRLGSHALSRDKTATLGMVIDSTLSEMREMFTKNMLVFLFELNGWDLKLMPKLKTGQVQYRDLDQIGEFVRALAEAGVPLLPTDEAVTKLYELVGLPPPDPDDGMALIERQMGSDPADEPEQPAAPAGEGGDA